MSSSGSFNTSGYDGRYLTFSWSVSSQSIENNSTTISWSLKGAGSAGSSWYNSGNFKVVINGTTVYSSATRIKLYNGTVVSSGTFTMTHDSSGNKSFSASAEAGIYYVAVNCSGSGSWSLPQISRAASITNAPNFTDEQNPTINYLNPAGNSVTTLQACISLTGSTDNIPYRNISKTGSSYTFNLTESERNILRAAAANSNTLSVIFYVKTIISGQTFYSTLTRTMTIVNAAPTISGISYKDTNAITIGITGNDQKIIQNNSNVSFTIGSIAARKSATLTKVSLTVNSVTVNSSLSGSSVSNKTVSFGTINSSSSLAATITVTDSRGNTSSANVNITMLAWQTPSAIITCARRNNYYTETDLKVNADYSSLDGKNTISIQYQTKESSGSTWGYLYNLVDNVLTTISLDNTKAWDIRVVVTDRLGSATYTISIDKGVPIIFFDKDKRSVGINCFPNRAESLEIDGGVKSSLGLISSSTGISGGTNGYARIATVKITGTYANAPIEFKVFRRGDSRPLSLFLSFSNANNSDPAISGLYIDSLDGVSNFDAFANKVATSKWDIYVKKSESYDHISVVTTVSEYMKDRVTIDYSDYLLSSKPSGATTATTF